MLVLSFLYSPCSIFYPFRGKYLKTATFNEAMLCETGFSASAKCIGLHVGHLARTEQADLSHLF